MKSLKTFIPLVLIVTLSGCLSMISIARNITGNIITGSPGNFKIGFFSNEYLFVPKSGMYMDEIDYESTLNTASYTPIIYGIINGYSYSIDLPNYGEGVIIAWNDLNKDNVFDIYYEKGYFPIKILNGQKTVIDNWDYNSGYLIRGKTPDSDIGKIRIDTAGTDSFNFEMY
ncbi:MAG: hypothetical protein GY760_22120 [Deltaproteobacteria bacterium]|nr:hypothetical protein [Deltaproteobacteria bacterium]